VKSIFLAALACFLILSAGCLTNREASMWAAIGLAEKTPEGELAGMLLTALEKTDECEFGECKWVFGMLKGFAPEEHKEAFQLSDEELEALMEKSKECRPFVKRNVEVVSEEVCIIGYEVIVSDSCLLDSFNEAGGKEFLVVRADLSVSEAEVLEGKLDEELIAQVNALKPGMAIVGNCFAPVAGAIGLQYFTPGTAAPAQ